MNPDVIKIQSHTGIAATVPYLLGFIPTDSLVVIGLEGPRDRMSFTMRIDLPLPADEAVAIDEVIRRMHAGGFERVIVVVYSDQMPHEGLLAHSGAVERLLAAFEVREALFVCGDRVWSYLCDNPDCCPAEGRTYLGTADATNVAAAHILHGRSVLMTRQQVIDSIAPVADTCDKVLAVLPVARSEFAAMTSDDRMGALGRLLAPTLARLDNPRAELTVEEIAQFVALLDDVDVRDSFLRRLALTDDPTWRSLVIELAHKSPPGHDAEVCCSLALRAYLDGDGVVARAGLDRALASDEGYTLARLLLQMLDEGVRPDSLRDYLERVDPAPGAPSEP